MIMMSFLKSQTEHVTAFRQSQRAIHSASSTTSGKRRNGTV
jgi:hypothetical protein